MQVLSVLCPFDGVAALKRGTTIQYFLPSVTDVLVGTLCLRRVRGRAPCACVGVCVGVGGGGVRLHGTSG